MMGTFLICWLVFLTLLGALMLYLIIGDLELYRDQISSIEDRIARPGG